MDATELLEADHQKVRSLFEQIQNVDHFAEKRRIFALIRQELEVHSNIEEAVFYPLFATRDGLIEFIEGSYDDHQEVRDLLDEIQTVLFVVSDQEQYAEQVEDKLDELMELVEHHVEEEEDELFPKVRELLDAEELEQVGAELEAARSENLSAA